MMDPSFVHPTTLAQENKETEEGAEVESTTQITNPKKS